MRNWKYINGAEVGNSKIGNKSNYRYKGFLITFSQDGIHVFLQNGYNLAFGPTGSEEKAKDWCDWHDPKTNKPVAEFRNSKTGNAIYSELNKDNKRVVIESDGSWYVYDKNDKIVEQGRESSSDNAFGKFKAKGYNKKACNQDGVARMFQGLVKDENKETEKDSGAIEELEKVGNSEEYWKKQYIEAARKKGIPEDKIQEFVKKLEKEGAKGVMTPIKNSSSDDKFAYVMREFEEGKLKSSSGETVTNPEQAKAIAHSESKKAENGLDRAWEAMKDKH